jgi:hypothetical protein
MFVGERLQLFAAQSNYPDYLIVVEHRTNRPVRKPAFTGLVEKSFG